MTWELAWQIAFLMLVAALMTAFVISAVKGRR